MLDGGVADAEEWGGSRRAGLRRSKETVVEQPWMSKVKCLCGKSKCQGWQRLIGMWQYVDACILERWHCKHALAHIQTFLLIPGQTRHRVMSCWVAQILVCDKEWRELNTWSRKGAETNGPEVPVVMSQITVLVVLGRSTEESQSEGNGWDCQLLSSGSLCWAATMTLKSMGWEELRRALVSRWIPALRDPWMWRISDVNWDGWCLWWSLLSCWTSYCSLTTSVLSSGRGDRLAAGQKGGSLMVYSCCHDNRVAFCKGERWAFFLVRHYWLWSIHSLCPGHQLSCVKEGVIPTEIACKPCHGVSNRSTNCCTSLARQPFHFRFGGGKERLVTFARYSWALPECWQSRADRLQFSGIRYQVSYHI